MSAERIALLPQRLFDGREIKEDHAVILECGHVHAVAPADRLEDVALVQMLDGLLAPGLVDLQVNGGGGVLLNDAPNADGIARVAKAHCARGTTAFLPTFITDGPELLPLALAAVAAARDMGIKGVAGIHLEGPYLSPEKPGVHPAQHMRQLEADEMRLITEADCGAILMTLAPEIVPPDRIKAMAAAGIVICAGHSAADADCMTAAIQAGMTGVTHLFNAMGQMETGREPGVAGMALASDSLSCGIIADGHHLHPAMLRLAYKAKGAEKLFLVSDAMPSLGDISGADHFELLGRRVTLADGCLRDESGRLAGAALSLAEMLPVMLAATGADEASLLSMATSVPAAFAGIGSRHGSIMPGRAADFVLFDDGFGVKSVWQDGQIVA